MERIILCTNIDVWCYFTQEQQAFLKEHFPQFKVVVKDRADISEADVHSAEIIYGQVSASHLPDAKLLRWYQLPSAGVNCYGDKALYYHDDIIVTNSSGVYDVPISEYIVAGILAMFKQFPVHFDNKQRHHWGVDWGQAREFPGSTVGIVGLGSIGSSTAKKLKAFDARIMAVKRTLSQKPDYVDELFDISGLPDLLKASDVVVVTLPGTNDTEGMFDSDKFAMMKKNAIFVNIGRGSIVDQDALIEALREEKIGGAVLDVTTPEPLPADSPLWDFPNVMITSHTSGNSNNNNARRFEIFTENLKNYIEGKPLSHRIHFDLGY